MRPWDRRRFMLGSLGLSATQVLSAWAGPGDPAKPGELLIYQEGPQIWVKIGAQLITSYRAHPSQKYPYFYPLNSLATGLSLTTESGQPWPHHRSCLFGCDRVNGGNYWQGPVPAGQIVSTGLKATSPAPLTAVIEDRCDWKKPSETPIMTDERRFTLTFHPPKYWTLDADLRWIAKTDIQVQKTNHSLFAIRAAADVCPSGGGQLVSNLGARGEKATAGQAAAWCAMFGPRAGIPGSVVEGITLMDHPKNPWAPCQWFTRDYGFMSPTPFNWLGPEGWKKAAGTSTRLRYRVVIHFGTPDEVGMTKLYEEWANSE